MSRLRGDRRGRDGGIWQKLAGLMASKRARRTKRRTWSKADVRELKAHSRSKSPVKKISKAMKGLLGRFGKRRSALGCR